MRLAGLYDTHNNALNECIGYAKSAIRQNGIICESTLNIDHIVERVRQDLIEKIDKSMQFGQVAWVEDLINGLKQAGVHGINEIEDRPVTISEIRKIVSLIMDIVKIR
jgi:hypothetical protein